MTAIHGLIGPDAEEVCPVGYINEDMEHVLISVRHPSLTNGWGKEDLLQVAVTIANAKALRDELIAFLAKHDGDLH